MNMNELHVAGNAACLALVFQWYEGQEQVKQSLRLQLV